MAIHIEFYGLARVRAGVSRLELPDADAVMPLGQLLARVAEQLPEFARECLPDGKLCPALAANLNAERFISDPATPIAPGQALLLVSADAGG